MTTPSRFTEYTGQDPRDAADVLRQAVDAIRAAVKEVARPEDRWTYRRTTNDPGHAAHIAAEGDPQWSGICDVIVGSGAEDHIAGADPATMFAVAELLQVISWMPSSADEVHLAAAVKVARTYLRTAATVAS